MTLQGGILLTGEPFTEGPFTETFVGALGGETLSRTPLLVPGGLAGIVAPRSLPGALKQSFEKAIGSGTTVVTATTELTGTPKIDRSSLESREGSVFSLPARIKLGNPFLGKECYIGSRASPVILNLTAGTTSPPPPNRPITGRDGDLNLRDELEFAELIGDSLVDNSFAVPRATGCGGSFSSLLDPAIDAKLGLPSAPGNNTFILDDTFQEASAVGVIASEK
jgi:hypothetical protein